ncbi:zinc metalloprotease HtpX [Desulfofundulus sp. TPOSR]|jgi:heat shock protein HtpX|uniref:Protease HtpX homolog n=1 Tax=Desulfofundulus kuznetsovii (strain DSM 6115 / VKM B-1805 / 17) TaxID=760568 RepID=A0AAU8P9P1_DESK7|nr:zinc metalloprotease HtpX [Desulfofundulus sp. TPOSR]AEG14670.1 protease htpX [Desulfofundulus kuznetsovii DSM 6115]NHM25856.1 zinc metalloprotease HtpX [Desulfofundulus sp. TPOSR]
MNNFRAWLLMGLLTVLLVLIGNAVAGSSGAFLFFLIALGMNFFGYYFSDRIAIAMTGSQPLAEHEAPELYAMIRNLAQRAGIPMPRVYRTPSPQPNAFATGRNPANAAVAVTDGLMQLLNRSEVEGVLAHEIAHIKNRDVLVGTIAAALAGAITMIANALQWGLIFGAGRDDEEGGNPLSLVGTLLMIILAPLAATLIQLAISRAREFEADATGARLAGSPHGLANALLKLERAAQHIPMQVNPATSHLFIVNPLTAESFARLFSTHPPIAERVRRLQQMQ